MKPVKSGALGCSKYTFECLGSHGFQVLVMKYRRQIHTAASVAFSSLFTDIYKSHFPVRPRQKVGKSLLGLFSALGTLQGTLESLVGGSFCSDYLSQATPEKKSITPLFRIT